jgi:hypothetical protein
MDSLIWDPVEIEDVEATQVSKSGEALLVWFDEGDSAWIPISVILEKSEVKGEGDIGTLIVPEWVAAEKGMI